MFRGANMQQYFTNKNILITGCTGFLGIGLVEKLLRSFPDSGKIYLLIRDKKETAGERAEKYFKNEAFKTIGNLDELVESKIIWLTGDVAKVNFGLNEASLKELFNHLDVIIHAAATTNFQAILSISVDVNVNGTKNVLDFATKCAKLKSFLFVSTAYILLKENALHLEEAIYEHPLNSEELLLKSKEELNTNCKELIKPYSSTYIYTKHAAECLVEKYVVQMPFIKIFRPGIICNAISEPFPYWRHEGGSIITYLEHIDKGFSARAKDNVNINLLPIDFVVNASLALIACETSHLVYNYTAANNPITREDLEDFFKAGMEDVNLKFGADGLHIMTTLQSLFHYMQGKRYTNNIHKFNTIFNAFLNVELTFANDNINELWGSMDDAAKKLLPFDMREINWKEFLGNMHRNIKQYMY